MNERRRKLAAIAAAGWPLALLLAACGGIEAGEAGSGAVGTVPRPPARIVRGHLESRLLLTGELEAADGQTLTVPRIPLRQVQIRWMEEDGTRVSEGDPVIQLDNEQVAQEIEEKRLDVTQKIEAHNQARANAELALADSDFSLLRAESELEKAELSAAIPEGLLSAREYQDRQLELSRTRVAVDKARQERSTTAKTGQADVDVAAVNLARSRRAVEEAERALDDLSLEAPGEGIFVIGSHPWENRPFQPGDNVWIGFTLAQIPDLATMVVSADLPDVDDGRIEVGMPVRCVLDAYPDDEVLGRVEEIAEVAKQHSGLSLRRFFEVRIGIEQDGSDRLRPGMSVKVEVLTQPEEQRLLVPRWAIDWSVEPVGVRLPDGSRRAVDLGACDQQWCAVAEAEGLTVGTTVLPVEGAG